MQILLNSNHSVDKQSVRASVQSELERFDDRLTRVEVHLNDVNSGKGGPADKRCQMEARGKGHDPVCATHKAESLELAIDGAAGKLNHALAHVLDKFDHH